LAEQGRSTLLGARSSIEQNVSALVTVKYWGNTGAGGENADAGAGGGNIGGGGRNAGAGGGIWKYSYWWGRILV